MRKNRTGAAATARRKKQRMAGRKGKRTSMEMFRAALGIGTKISAERAKPELSCQPAVGKS